MNIFRAPIEKDMAGASLISEISGTTLRKEKHWKWAGGESEYGRFFSFQSPSVAPDERIRLPFPEGKKVLITDLYMQPAGEGGLLLFLEEDEEGNFDHMFLFSCDFVVTGRMINFTTGLTFESSRIWIENRAIGGPDIIVMVSGRLFD